jgi:hypothetical protein
VKVENFVFARSKSKSSIPGNEQQGDKKGAARTNLAAPSSTESILHHASDALLCRLLDRCKDDISLRQAKPRRTKFHRSLADGVALASLDWHNSSVLALKQAKFFGVLCGKVRGFCGADFSGSSRVAG